jgi:aryl-alcohol dehydrogenase-like predicted oxidoreductase
LNDQLNGSLRRLRTDYIDLLQIHEADFAWWWLDNRGRDFENWPFLLIEPRDDFDIAGAPVLRFVQAAIRDGKARFWGITGKNAPRLTLILHAVSSAQCLMIAHQYNAIYRNANVLIDAAVSAELGVIIGAPLMRGWLAKF